VCGACFGAFLDQAPVRQHPGEMLGQGVVPGRGGTPEVVEGQPEPLPQPGLHLVHLGESRPRKGHPEGQGGCKYA